MIPLLTILYFPLTIALELMYKEQMEKEAAAAQAIEAEEYAPIKKKMPTYKAKMRGLSRLVCSYCWSGTSAKWRKGNPQRQ